MLRRRRVSSDSTATHAPRHGGRLRNAFVDAGWAIREHVFWRLGDAIRHGADAAKWPFERIAWAVRNGIVWPVEDRAGALGPVARGGSFALVIVLAAGAGVAGLLWAAPDHSKQNATTVAIEAQATAPVATAVSKPEPVAKPQPTLHGTAPIFKPEDEGDKAGKKHGGKGPSSSPATTAPAPTGSGQAKPLAPVLSSSGPKPAGAALASSARQGKDADKVAGPKAIDVARRFAAAFVLYETGRGDKDVRKAFAETAAPELRHSLLRRPPRLPANVKVPKAKVLNIVPGPSHGGVYSVSVSLLRVGLTSELRLDMEPGKGKQWQVTDILG
jgi:hypothetical protein